MNSSTNRLVFRERIYTQSNEVAQERLIERVEEAGLCHGEIRVCLYNGGVVFLETTVSEIIELDPGKAKA